jgi:hypothetical protein
MHALHRVGFTAPMNHSTGDRADYRGLFILTRLRRETSFLWHFPLSDITAGPVAVSDHPALWCSDFPLA